MRSLTLKLPMQTSWAGSPCEPASCATLRLVTRTLIQGRLGVIIAGHGSGFGRSNPRGEEPKLVRPLGALGLDAARLATLATAARATFHASVEPLVERRAALVRCETLVASRAGSRHCSKWRRTG